MSTYWSTRTFEEKVAEAPSPENLENLEACKTVYERKYDYMVRGSIIRSRARWYEQGERNTKYFLNLENHNKKKSCVRRLLNSDGAEITDANNILDEVHNFCSDLYDEKTGIQTDTHCPFLVDSLTIPKLNDDMRKICDGQLQEKMRGQRGRLRALAGICHVHESYF